MNRHFLIGVICMTGGFIINAQGQQPHEDVHPNYTLVDISPSGINLDGIDEFEFLSDGRMVVVNYGLLNYNGASYNTGFEGANYTQSGGVHIISGVATAQNGADLSIETLADDLYAPLGLVIVNDEIYVHEQGGCPSGVSTRIRKFSYDGSSWSNTIFAEGWGCEDVCYHWHSMAYNLAHTDGYLYLTPGSMLQKWQVDDPECQPTPQNDNQRGVGIKVNLADPSDWSVVGRGLRSIAGMEVAFEGQVFAYDNQGDYRPDNFVLHLREGADYGHRTYHADYDPIPGVQTISPDEMSSPSVVIPYPYPSRCIMNPISMYTGTYAGQILVGDNTDGGINRIFMEKINGFWQGAVWDWSEGMLWDDEFNPHALAVIPGTNDIVVGSGGDNDVDCVWCPWWGGKIDGIKKMVWQNNDQFEMLAIRSTGPNGFELEFTHPVDPGTIDNNDFEVRTWTEAPNWNYGQGSMVDEHGLNVTATEMVAGSGDNKVNLSISGLSTGTSNGDVGMGNVVHIDYSRVRSEGGESPWTGHVYYTLNQFGPGQDPDITNTGTSHPPKINSGGYSARMIKNNLELNIRQSGISRIEIFNTRGEVVYKSEFSGPGTYKLKPILNPGFYILNISGGDLKNTMKIVVLP